MSLRRVLHIEYLVYAEESGQSRQALAAHRRQLHGSPVTGRVAPNMKGENLG